MTKFLKKAAAASRLSWVDDGGDMFIPSVYISCDRGLFDFVNAFFLPVLTRVFVSYD